MPANLPPAYRAAEERLRAAVTVEEKIAALEEMLRVMPKHKGTEKLQADVRGRISRLKRQPKKKAGARGPSHHIPRQGAGQVVLVGPPNSGKSSLVAHLTHAEPEVANYPLTTREATPGMMPWRDVSIQLVDLPPVCEEHVEPWVYDCVRTTDLVWLVLAVESSLEGLELVTRLLGEHAIGLEPVGSEPFDDRRPGWRYRRALLVLTGVDRPDAREDLELLDELLAEMGDRPWSWTAVSTLTGEGLDDLGRGTFEALDILRVYSKQPGKPADMEQPFTLAAGSTVGDLARLIHKEVAEGFKFARVWGTSAFDGQRVQANHELADRDVVEIHV